MKPKTLAVLSALALVLGTFIYFFERDVPSTDERGELEKKVLGIDAGDVQSFTVRRPDADPETIRFVRATDEEDDGRSDGESDEGAEAWRLAEPLDAPADAAEVAGVLERLVGLEKERDLDDVDRAAAGLDVPRLEVIFDTGDGEQRLLVGVDVPLDGGVLVERRGGDGEAKVMQAKLATDLFDDLRRGTDAWRDRDLFPALRADVGRITLRGGPSDPASDGEAEVVLAREGDGESFRIESPVADRADPDRVRVLLAALTGLEAKTFLDEAEPLADPAATVQVALAGRDEPFRIELGPVVGSGPATENAEIRARVDGREVTVAAGSWHEMATRDAAAWRSRAWSALQVFQVDEATFVMPGHEPLTLRRDGSDWLRRIGAGEPEKIAYSAASDALYPPTEIRAADIRRRAEVSEDTLASPPRLEIRFRTQAQQDAVEGEATEETLRLWGSLEAAGLDAATAADRDGVVLLLPSAEVDELLREVDALRRVEPVAAEEGADEASDEETP